MQKYCMKFDFFGGEGVKFYIWSGDGILYIGKSLAHHTFLESSRVGDFFYIPRREPSPLPWVEYTTLYKAFEYKLNRIPPPSLKMYPIQ